MVVQCGTYWMRRETGVIYKVTDVNDQTIRGTSASLRCMCRPARERERPGSGTGKFGLTWIKSRNRKERHDTYRQNLRIPAIETARVFLGLPRGVDPLPCCDLCSRGLVDFAAEKREPIWRTIADGGCDLTLCQDCWKVEVKKEAQQ